MCRCISECVIGRYCEHVVEYASEARDDIERRAYRLLVGANGRLRRDANAAVTIVDDINAEAAVDEPQSSRERRRAHYVPLDDALASEAVERDTTRRCAQCIAPTGDFGFVGKQHWYTKRFVCFNVVGVSK